MRLLFTLGMFLIFQPVVSQSDVERIYQLNNRQYTSRYTLDPRYDRAILASRFSRDSIHELRLEDRRIYKIDLVYTAFRESMEFDQDELNKARLSKLLALNPGLAENDLISWNLVEQSGCNSSRACLDFFHGFVIYYNKLYTKEDTRAEIDSIEVRLKQLEHSLKNYDSLIEYHSTDLGCSFPESIYSNEYLTDEFKKFYECDERFRGRLSFVADLDDKGRPLGVDVVEHLYSCNPPIEETLRRILRWKSGVVIDGNKFPVTVEGSIEFPIRNGSIRFERFIIPDSLISRFHIRAKQGHCTAMEIDSVFLKVIPLIDKHVVSDVLFRNSWSVRLFVVDVTGSMYPYTADLLKWLRLASIGERKTFVFFNDGNDAPDQSKVVGNTGGIYSIHSYIYSDIKQQMYTTMRRGGGGDLAENNFEALLTGQELTGRINEAVMIADNFSFPRDEVLLKNYNGSLKIILCGTYLGINPEYLNLAAMYKFSIHTAQSDVYRLHQMRKGENILIDGFRYKLTDAGFKRDRPTN